MMRRELEVSSLFHFLHVLFTLFQPPSPGYELENLTGAKRKEESPPPEYHSVVIKDPDGQLPDYYDDCVKKVAVPV